MLRKSDICWVNFYLSWVVFIALRGNSFLLLGFWLFRYDSFLLFLAFKLSDLFKRDCHL